MICLTLIARNEARCLARCLRSAAPFVDEMVVVDTGSTDTTRQIALDCGARVVGFAWRDDFAAARNFALQQTGAQWRLVLDADEWIESGGDSLRAAVRERSDPFVGQVQIRHAFDDGDAVRVAPSWVSRFLPQTAVYRGAIHEQVTHKLPVRRLPVRVGHDGFRRAQQVTKSGRNERLLLAALEREPGDPYLLYQLGKEWQMQERHAEACISYARARALMGWPPADSAAAQARQMRFPWLHDLVVREIYCMKLARQFDQAWDLAQAQASWWRHSPDFDFAVGDLLLDCAMARPERADQLLPLIEASWMHCLQVGEAPQLEGSVEGRGSFLAAHNLAAFHESLGQPERARHFRDLARACHPAGGEEWSGPDPAPAPDALASRIDRPA